MLRPNLPARILLLPRQDWRLLRRLTNRKRSVIGEREKIGELLNAKLGGCAMYPVIGAVSRATNCAITDYIRSAQPVMAERNKDKDVQPTSKDQGHKDQENKNQDVANAVDTKAGVPEGAVSDQARPTPATSVGARLPETPKAVTSTRLPSTPERPSVPEKSVPQTVPVSAARGPFPQLEMFSVSPRRHNTIHGTATS